MRKVAATSRLRPRSAPLIALLLSLPFFACTRARAPVRVLCLGDSLTAGTAGSIPYPALLSRELGPGFEVVNAGVSGARTGDLLAGWQRVRSDRQGWLVVLAGVNDVNQGAAPSEVTINLRSIVEDAIALRKQVILITLLPEEGSARWSPAAQASLETVNGWIRDYGRTHSVAVIDGFAEFGQPGQPQALGSSWSAGDHIHLGPAGAARLARLVKAAMEPRR